MNVVEKLKLLRAKMQQEGIDAVVIRSADPHQSEYLPDHWKMREWISGFTGSAGTVLVTADGAGLWTDSRYFIQAEKQLKGSTIQLHKMGEDGVLSIEEWLAEWLSPGSAVHVPALTMTPVVEKKYKKALEEKEIDLKMDGNLVGEIWKDRPPLPTEKVYEYEMKYAAVSRVEKMAQLRSKMSDKKVNSLFVSALDEIAYLLNLRGRDVECNPVFLAYLLVQDSKITLFVDREKLDDSLIEKLGKDNIEVENYHRAIDALKNLDPNTQLWVDPYVLNCEMYREIRVGIYEKRSPVVLMKAVKTKAECDHIRNAMVKDGVALFRGFEWLKSTLKNRTVSEFEFSEKLIEFRSRQMHYIGESFNAIVGYRGNGAIVHYRAEEGDCAEIEDSGMLLVDSGGQYLDGTTDITRTIHLGVPTEEEKKHFTWVLKGMIALTLAEFPNGTMGVQLDAIARMPLWKEGLNFGHGTGHGVGYFLNVHEPPQGIVPNLTERGKTKFDAGMITSNEPGFYLEGQYGIRCENLILSTPASEEDFLKFENLTLFPFDSGLIKTNLLSVEELRWLNEYHQLVWKKLAPYLNEVESKNLADQCKSLSH